MKQFKVLSTIMCTLSLFLCSCAGINQKLADKYETIEYYRIFDIKTSHNRYEIAKAAMDGFTKNCGTAKEEMPIPNYSTPPDTPGRFQIKNIFEGSRLSTLMEAQGASIQLKMVSCPEAVWIGRATKKNNDWYTIKVTGCLFEYSEGYHLDLYAIMSKQTGGINISKSIAEAVVGKALGTPEQWTEKIFADIIRTIYDKTGADIKFLEGYPPVVGMPWIDTGKDVYGHDERQSASDNDKRGEQINQ